MGHLPDISPVVAVLAVAPETSPRSLPFWQPLPRHLLGRCRFGSRLRDISPVVAVLAVASETSPQSLPEKAGLERQTGSSGKSVRWPPVAPVAGRWLRSAESAEYLSPGPASHRAQPWVSDRRGMKFTQEARIRDAASRPGFPEARPQGIASRAGMHDRRSGICRAGAASRVRFLKRERANNSPHAPRAALDDSLALG